MGQWQKKALHAVDRLIAQIVDQFIDKRLCGDALHPQLFMRLFYVMSNAMQNMRLS